MKIILKLFDCLDLATFFDAGANYFGGYPWEPATKAIRERESPITLLRPILFFEVKKTGAPVL
ncbi:MAG: hypothetical protein ABI813_09770 [Bacteroidota bacterium]